MPNSRSFDDFPVYDPIVKGPYLTPLWQSFVATFYETLISYLTPYGVFLPQLSTTDKSEFRAPYLARVGLPLGDLPNVSGLTAWDITAEVPIVFKITFAGPNIATANWHDYVIL